jgi:hypothetical protein
MVGNEWNVISTLVELLDGTLREKATAANMTMTDEAAKAL